jgi:lipopolysaccharide transport system ATP-binding protein
MDDVAIQVDGLSKKFRLGGPQERYATLRDQVRNLVSRRGLLRRAANGKSRPEFWALKDVSFEVKRGEVVGIIGRNGAGKSTLLKILSRITEPTEGGADIHGRVGSLLEVGTGFHQELTGRENIYLNGAILGMRRTEISRKFDDIVGFAEVEKFIDTPVKHYSSGMYFRLAFAVAAHLEPEILIIDEVLAVGDAEFQRKCLGKMGEAANGGRTVLFVSHNMGAVQRLCSRSLLLNRGRVINYGPTGDIVRAYLAAYDPEAAFSRQPDPSGRPTIVGAAVLNPPAEGRSVVIEVVVGAGTARTVGVDVRLTDLLGNPVGYGSVGAFAHADMVPLREGSTRVRLEVLTDALASGEYLASVDVTNPEVEYYDRADGCLRFEVVRQPVPGRDRVLSQTWGYGSYELPVRLYQG